MNRRVLVSEDLLRKAQSFMLRSPEADKVTVDLMQEVMLSDERLKRMVTNAKVEIYDLLISYGDQCCGGAGREINKTTGKPYGDDYYRIADMIAREITK
jgi:hypothetical protein